jgi:hypothetical protein
MMVVVVVVMVVVVVVERNVAVLDYVTDVTADDLYHQQTYNQRTCFVARAAVSGSRSDR